MAEEGDDGDGRHESSSRNSRRKKRELDREHDADHVEGRAVSRRGQQEEELHVDSNKKIKKKPASAVVPHKARKLNDTLKDFQSNFGISSSPSTATSSKKPRSTSTAQHGFKSSFEGTPTRVATAASAAAQSKISLEESATTPIKQSSSTSKNRNILLQPPESHKKLLDERNASTSLDKGKGRAIETDDPSAEQHNGQISRHIEKTDALSSTSKSRPHGNVTSLSELSAKKQFRMAPTLYTPSKPSPLAGRQLPSYMREDTVSSTSDIKPLKSLGVISGLNTLLKPTSTNNDPDNLLREATEDTQQKPKWAHLLDSTSDLNSRKDSTNIDVTELLSPRKKRKGWVPAGYAENAAGIIKRLQTGNNLWIHEISRLLANVSSKGPANGRVKKEHAEEASTSDRSLHSDSGTKQGNKRDYEVLLRDLNPHLRLEILDILSPKPASLTWSNGEGGFITAGSAEKLLITRCQILKDKDDRNSTSSHSFLPSQADEKREAQQQNTQSSTGDDNEWESQTEGMVIFSLTAHSRTSTGITILRKEQPRPDRQVDDSSTAEDRSGPDRKYHIAHNQEKSQPLLSFNKKDNRPDKSGKKWNVYLPASIADLHTQMRTGDEIWAWEPWSVVDIVTSATAPPFWVQTRTASDMNQSNGNAQAQVPVNASEKTLLVSRFAVLL